MALNIIRKSMILIPFYPNICYHKNNETFPIENIMPSPKIIELEQILQTYSIEDKQWLLQQLIQQLGLNHQEKPPVNYKQQAKGIIAETISEVLALSNDCEEQVWQKFYAASGRISEKLNESDFL
jgi:hypothetical protein